mmetsp:Transcript_5909/g.9075  ORF Transcript_5909/g.9075 Transcript_5909/m.9075 type:complete len:516 (-) Transcript_5909:478-2025(-)
MLLDCITTTAKKANNRIMEANTPYSNQSNEFNLTITPVAITVTGVELRVAALLLLVGSSTGATALGVVVFSDSLYSGNVTSSAALISLSDICAPASVMALELCTCSTCSCSSSLANTSFSSSSTWPFSLFTVSDLFKCFFSSSALALISATSDRSWDFSDWTFSTSCKAASSFFLATAKSLRERSRSSANERVLPVRALREVSSSPSNCDTFSCSAWTSFSLSPSSFSRVISFCCTMATPSSAALFPSSALFRPSTANASFFLVSSCSLLAFSNATAAALSSLSFAALVSAALISSCAILLMSSSRAALVLASSPFASVIWRCKFAVWFVSLSRTSTTCCCTSIRTLSTPNPFAANFTRAFRAYMATNFRLSSAGSNCGGAGAGWAEEEAEEVVLGGGVGGGACVGALTMAYSALTAPSWTIRRCMSGLQARSARYATARYRTGARVDSVLCTSSTIGWRPVVEEAHRKSFPNDTSGESPTRVMTSSAPASNTLRRSRGASVSRERVMAEERRVA